MLLVERGNRLHYGKLARRIKGYEKRRSCLTYEHVSRGWRRGGEEWSVEEKATKKKSAFLLFFFVALFLFPPFFPRRNRIK